MMTLYDMNILKKRMGLSYRDISERSGVPISTVQKIFMGTTKRPRHTTLLALAKAFEEDGSLQTANAGSESGNKDPDRVNRISHAADDFSGNPEDLYAGTDYSEITLREHTRVAEASPAYEYRTDRNKYPRQGSYTVYDYLALPDDQRVELIDGVFYDMAAPYPVHQFIDFMLGHYFQNFIEGNGGPCIVLPSPIDVQLDKDDKTVVQPDLCIVCDQSIIDGPRLYGAPDLLIEVLSRSTRKKDLTLKNSKYCRAGVKEYWTVDPARLRVTVFDYQHEGEISVYSFHDTVPVGIYDGELQIDFEKILERIQGMYGVGTDI